MLHIILLCVRCICVRVCVRACVCGFCQILTVHFSSCACLQDLLNLFIEHQVPSDLLSYDGDPAAHVSTKLAAVKQCVQNMQEMIDRASKVH